ncbi:xylose isomerase-like protein [Lipomyces kononenkoae]|uniref:Xylose isomerase-like protein n=1 Tax=Lipomyces kononenkoae TaxID=34357 RepID=A0ACC3SVV9_LIPKO
MIGVYNAITNGNRIGCNALALFVKQQRRWTSPPIKPEEKDQFGELLKEYKYDASKHILPHGSYLINLANIDGEKNEQAYSAFLDELQRCESLGIGRYNFHPGSTLGLSKPDAIKRVAANINAAIKATKFVKIVLENMAGHGNLIGSTFEDLADVIALVDDKSRVGVCIDTCHTFAAGYDIRTQESYDKMWSEFDKIIGLKYLSGIHLNDSKAPFGSNRDLHQNIGLGFLGLESFRILMNTKHVEGLPMVLETPNHKDDAVWGREIKLLEWLIGKSADNPDFVAKRDELWRKGAQERSAMEQKTKGKDGKKQSKLKVGKKRKVETDDEEEYEGE